MFSVSYHISKGHSLLFSMVDELVWKVQAGSTHTSGALAGMSGRLPSARSATRSTSMWLPQHSMELRESDAWWVRAPGVSLPGDPGRRPNCWDLVSEIPEGHLCHILLVKQVTKGSQAMESGIEHEKKSMKEFVTSLIYHESVIQISLSWIRRYWLG